MLRYEKTYVNDVLAPTSDQRINYFFGRWPQPTPHFWLLGPISLNFLCTVYTIIYASFSTTWVWFTYFSWPVLTMQLAVLNLTIIRLIINTLYID